MIKFKNYTTEEIEYIKNNYCNATIKQIAKDLNKTPNSVTRVAFKMGLKKQEHKPWSEDEISFLNEHYIDMTSEEIAKILNRTVVSINSKRDALGLVRHPNWTNSEVEFLRNNYETMSHSDIGEALGKTQGAVTAKCFDLNLYKKEKPWEQWELDFVRDNYMEMSKREISEILNRSLDAIQVKANRMGLKKSPYSCDYHYFDIIDTEEKAYWLGFLTADGWVNKNIKNGSGVVGIELQYGDIKHLKKFNKSLAGNYQITDRWRPCKISTKDPNKKHHTCVIRIFSLIMYNSLVKLGFANDKSYNFSMPKLSPELMRHYMRGYFDGDGCLTVTNRSFNVSFVTVSKQINDDIINVLQQQNIGFSGCSYINDFDTLTFVPRINRYADKIKFLDWIYQDCNIYLDRKYKKYLKVKESQKQTIERDGLAV